MSIKIFIGSSSKSLDIAYTLQAALFKRNRDYLPVSWNQLPFTSEYFFLNILNELKKCDYAVFIFNNDDISKIENTFVSVTRDNVLFELGIAIGYIGLERCFIIKPDIENFHMPEDLKGLDYYNYNKDNLEQNAEATITPAILRIEDKIKFNSKKEEQEYKMISWENLCSNILQLTKRLRSSVELGGFQFDLMLGVSRGGIIIADLLSRQYGSKIPSLCLWADRDSIYPDVHFNNKLNASILSLIMTEKINKILIVDDIVRTGKTLIIGAKFLRELFPHIAIKTATIYIGPEVDERSIDYYIERVGDTKVRLPFSLLD